MKEANWNNNSNTAICIYLFNSSPCSKMLRVHIQQKCGKKENTNFVVILVFAVLIFNGTLMALLQGRKTTCQLFSRIIQGKIKLSM